MIWLMSNWLLCNNRMDEDHRQSQDTSNEPILVALEGASKGGRRLAGEKQT